MMLPHALAWTTVAALALGLLASAALVPATQRDGPTEVNVPSLRAGDTGTYAFFDAQDRALGLVAFRILGPDRATGPDGASHDVATVRSNRTSGGTTVTLEEHLDRTTRLTVSSELAQAHEDFAEVVSSFAPTRSIVPGIEIAGSTLRPGAELAAVEPGTQSPGIPWWRVVNGSVEPGHDAGAGARSGTAELTSDERPVPCTGISPARVERGGSLDRMDALEVVSQVSCGGAAGTRSLWFTASVPVAAYATFTGGSAGPSTPEVSMALVAFERGDGPPLAWSDASPDTPRALEPAPGVPTTGRTGVFPYPIERALDDVSTDPDLLRFHLWRESHADAQVVSARLARGEHSWEERNSDTWRFVFAASDGSAHEVATERVRGSGERLVSDRGPMEIAPERLGHVAARTILLSDAVDRWRDLAGPAYASLTPNYVHWGLAVPMSWADDCDHVPRDTGLIPTDRPADSLVVGHSTYGTCITPKIERRESYVVLDAATGLGQAAVEHRFRLDAFPAGDVHRADTSVVRPVPAGSALRAPDLQITALTTTTLLALVWGTYLWPVLKFALAKGAVALRGYTRIEPSALLDNPTRRTLVERLDAEPGLSAGELAQALDIGWGTLAHHAKLLEDAGIITTCVVGRHRHFFRTGTVEPGVRRAVALLRHEGTRRVHRTLVGKPGLPLSELAAQLGMTPAGALWHVRRLERAGLAQRARRGREVLCHPGPVDAPGDA